MSARGGSLDLPVDWTRTFFPPLRTSCGANSFFEAADRIPPFRERTPERRVNPIPPQKEFFPPAQVLYRPTFQNSVLGGRTSLFPRPPWLSSSGIDPHVPRGSPPLFFGLLRLFFPPPCVGRAPPTNRIQRDPRVQFKTNPPFFNTQISPIPIKKCENFADVFHCH